MLRILTLYALVCSAVCALGQQPVRIGVSLLPLESLVKEIGGASVEVRSLQREGDSCSVFEPRPSAISWLSSAKLFFRIGAAYEPAIIGKLQSQYSGLEVVDLRDVAELNHAGHNHDHGEHHHCETCSVGTDPHIWLDPVNLAALADKVALELGKLLPENRHRFETAANQFRQELMRTHRQLSDQLGPFHGKAFFIYHPALGYFAERYHLQQIAIAVSSQGPSARQLHELINQARELEIRTVFVQPQESKRHAEIVAQAIGAEIVEIDPMSTDLVNNLLQIGNSLANAFLKE